jgi:flavodoxin I
MNQLGFSRLLNLPKSNNLLLFAVTCPFIIQIPSLTFKCVRVLVPNSHMTFNQSNESIGLLQTSEPRTVPKSNLLLFVVTSIHHTFLSVDQVTMKIFQVAALIQLVPSLAFMPISGSFHRARVVQLDMANTAIIFGTSTGSTETVADFIAENLVGEVDGPFDVDTVEGSVKDFFEKYDSLIVGTPTWNTGAETERSGTGWDEIYYGGMQEMKLKGKKVAVFGLGDQISYDENYADATGELHDVFEGLGCKLMGYTSQEGYEHVASKAVRGELFCGLLCDQVNEEELSEGRVKAWVAQLKSEGFFEGGSVASAPQVMDAVAEPIVAEPIVAEPVASLDQTIETNANDGFQPHHNPKTKSTIWVSADGRSCYYTVATPKAPSVLA